MIINLSPQHPSTHGVLRSITIMNGEIIKWITLDIGLLHRGTEKLLERNYYKNSIGYFDRPDYVSGVIQELPFVLTSERPINSYLNEYIPL